MKFQLNAAGCGKGKTFKNKALIKANPTEKFLVIVPSINLARSYKEANTFIITSKTDDGSDAANVQKSILNALDSDKRVIVITHCSFLRCEFKERLVADRIVIQDEEIAETYRTHVFNDSNHRGIVVTSMYPEPKLKEEHKDWYEMFIQQEQAEYFIKHADTFEDVKFIRDLMSSPYALYSNTDVNDTEATKESDRRYIFAVLKPEVYAGAKKVIITCTNFKKTTQGYIWNKLFDCDYDVIEEFDPYSSSRTTVHYALQEMNSKKYNRENPELRKAFISYIKPSLNEKVVYIDNNYNADINGWVRLTHNVHGENNHDQAKHIVMLSAINRSGIETAFLEQVVGMTTTEIRSALTGELMHQVAMRGVLRKDNDAECHIYVMEAFLADYASKIFPNAKLVEIPETNRKVIEKTKTEKLSGSEKVKASNIRKLYPEYKNYTGEEIKCLPIWAKTSTRGTLKF